jgi:hypothetical protein
VPQWRDVPGFVGFYQVSDEGQVQSLPRIVMRKNGAPQTIRGRILRPGFTEAGYPIVALAREGAQTMAYVHHLVLEAFVGPKPPGQECRHINGVEADCHHTNLVWGTHLQNEHDKRDHGTTNEGIRNPHAILTPVAVREIREMYATGIPLHEIAPRYGIAKETVFSVVRMDTWQQVDGVVPDSRKKRVKHNPWTAHEEALIQTMPPIEAAKKLDRTVSSVKMRLWRVTGTSRWNP